MSAWENLKLFTCVSKSVTVLVRLWLGEIPWHSALFYANMTECWSFLPYVTSVLLLNFCILRHLSLFHFDQWKYILVIRKMGSGTRNLHHSSVVTRQQMRSQPNSSVVTRLQLLHNILLHSCTISLHSKITTWLQ